MLKMIIVDDERAIRESIRDTIDWAAQGISVAGLCKNGMEAYDMILDEYPDIVMTDIKMPGIDGLELIAQITQAKLDCAFVILSGHGEFDYAREAMRWGVKHYLLKPSSAENIIGVIREVREDCYRKRAVSGLLKRQRQMSISLRQNMMRMVLSEALAGQMPLAQIIQQHRQYLDFDDVNYECCYLYFLPEAHVDECARLLAQFHQAQAPDVPMHMVYVKMTLAVFFEGYSTGYDAWDRYVREMGFGPEAMRVEYERKPFASLRALLEGTVPRLSRFEVILLMDGSLRRTKLHNYQGLMRRMDALVGQWLAAPAPGRQALQEALREQMEAATDRDLLLASLTNILLKQAARSVGSADMLKIPELLMQAQGARDSRRLCALLISRLETLADATGEEAAEADASAKIIRLVGMHLSNPELSLKWLAENHLYMSVDYLSKQFMKQTGERFSAYLTRKRVEYAAQLLACGMQHIYEVAEAVGYGNHPQYFSQIFRKSVGMTPSEYIRNQEGTAGV